MIPLSDRSTATPAASGATAARATAAFTSSPTAAWYGPATWSNSLVVGQREKGVDGAGHSQFERVWSLLLGGRACPTAAVAYGRLYYCGNGEAIVYCFESDVTRQPSAARPQPR